MGNSPMAKEPPAVAGNQASIRLRLDLGEERTRVRQRWWQLWVPSGLPPPPPASLDDAPITPLATASFISTLTFAWMTPILVLGYRRTLQATDLWALAPDQESGTLSDSLDASWAKRVATAEDWNARLENGRVHPRLLTRSKWFIQSRLRKTKGQTTPERRLELEAEWRRAQRRSASLAWALNDVFGLHFWLGGLFKVFGDTAQLMGPLVVKAIINFSKERDIAKHTPGQSLPSIGPGIGLAIGAFLLVIATSVGTHQFFYRSMTTGALARAALIASIYKRGVSLTPSSRARTGLGTSALVNHISTDVSRIDACAQWFHAAWTAPVQVVVCLIILLIQLGPSALAGFALFILIIPLQKDLMSRQFAMRTESVRWTEQRAKLLLETIGAMRVVKYFTYEFPFLQRISELRKKEMRGLRNIQFSRSGNLALSSSIPVLASTLAFVTYTATSHNFDAAIVFASLNLFQSLRQPMTFGPRALSAIADARSAIERLQNVFHAEIMSDTPISIDEDQELSLSVTNATFEWEPSLPISKVAGKRRGPSKSAKPAPVTVPLDNVEQPLFRVRNVNMDIPRGTLVAIVGPVGSGKSSLLQGLIGEMRRVQGDVVFGGRVAYCPQTAWIQNATLRDNILFGQEYHEERYWRAVQDASLMADLEALPAGEMTEIGEKGITLSGGQKQRVNIARALYYDADIVIFDDPLSAVDAHVGKALFNDAILNAVRGSGRSAILVTHALHFLSQCDYIYTMEGGCIREHGTYPQLVANGAKFSELDKAFGGASDQTDVPEDGIEAKSDATAPATVDTHTEIEQTEPSRGTDEREIGKDGQLIGREQRETGSLKWTIYKAYLVSARYQITGPVLIIALILAQGFQITNSFSLVWWQTNEFDRPESFYQMLYALLGIGQALAILLLCMSVDVMAALVSKNMHHAALQNIFHAPLSFFDITPTGRILGVFGKDIDTLDDQLPVSLKFLILTGSTGFGAVILVTILEHYFLIVVFIIGFAYRYFFLFYGSSARELKRIDSLLRSLLYSHFSESLTGLPTIRSYGKIAQFITNNRYYIDTEDRALLLTVTNQRWLAIRLDFLGGILVFVVAIFAVVGVSGINPAEIGLVLTYTNVLSQLSVLMTRQIAEVENYMNATERLVSYSNGSHVEREAPYTIEATAPPTSWPSEGRVEFTDVVMKYRPGLPNVLHGISMSIAGGEKIGVVGRTGAGKSSLLLALFRIVELTSGSIHVDGIDISKIGLQDLRSKISIIPQDPLLFSGTIRSNLDPFSRHTDAELWDALHRSFLVEDASEKKYSSEDSSTIGKPGRFNLETVIESEGQNLSVGERSLLSLARALVKACRIVVLDEATASVDLETDSKIQETIKTQFKDSTLLCIAHRLRTIIDYDRVLVLDGGRIAEFDTPLNLFQRPDGIFRGMCEKSRITLADLSRGARRASNEDEKGR